jgi:hypothetical protein
VVALNLGEAEAPAPAAAAGGRVLRHTHDALHTGRPAPTVLAPHQGFIATTT